MDYRPFLSGQVAYSLASEVIGLLHGLVTVPGAAEVWSTAIREVNRSVYNSFSNYLRMHEENTSGQTDFVHIHVCY